VILEYVAVQLLLLLQLLLFNVITVWNDVIFNPFSTSVANVGLI
jgi:hypothetical protein